MRQPRPRAPAPGAARPGQEARDGGREGLRGVRQGETRDGRFLKGWQNLTGVVCLLGAGYFVGFGNVDKTIYMFLTPLPKGHVAPSSLCAVNGCSLGTIIVEPFCGIGGPDRQSLDFCTAGPHEPVGNFHAGPERFGDTPAAERVESHQRIADRDPAIGNRRPANAGAGVKAGPLAQPDPLLHETAGGRESADCRRVGRTRIRRAYACLAVRGRCR